MKVRVFVSAVLLALAVGVGVAHASCTLASVAGTYGILQTAKNGTGGIGAGNGQLTFDGLGHLTGTQVGFVTYTSSTGWKDSTGTFTGTYTVAANCTGTVITVDSSGSKARFSFVADNSEGGSQFIRVDNSGAVQLGFLVAAGSATCGLGTSSRVFAAELSGVVIGTGPVGYVGRVVLSAKGGVSGTMSVNVNGKNTNASITGTYSEASDCTGTATITPAGFSPLHFSFVVVNSGKELLFLETDNDTVVSGNLQM